MKCWGWFAWVALGWSLATTAAARPTGQPLDLRPNRLALEVGAQPSLALELSYGRRFSHVVGRTHVTPVVALGFPVAGVVDGRTWNADIGASWMVPLWRELGVTANAALTLATARNPNAELAGLGLELGALPGWYSARWFAAAELTYLPSYATHVRHRAAARETFQDRYPAMASDAGPRDGWYGGSAHRLRVGVQAGLSIRRRAGFYVAAGYGLSATALGLVAFPDVGLLPFYARLGVLAAW